MIFVCVTNSGNIITLFHRKVISHDQLQNIYSNLPGTRKNKIHENKIKLNWLLVLKKIYYCVTDRRAKILEKFAPVLFQLFQFSNAAHQIWEKHP